MSDEQPTDTKAHVETYRDEYLNRKNVMAARQAIDNLTTMVHEQHIRIDLLHAALASALERMNAMERLIQMQRVQLTGTGPSVK
jgi:uncharacterized coiled-coil protein SlyX